MAIGVSPRRGNVFKSGRCSPYHLSPFWDEPVVHWYGKLMLSALIDSQHQGLLKACVAYHKIWRFYMFFLMSYLQVEI